MRLGLQFRRCCQVTAMQRKTFMHRARMSLVLLVHQLATRIEFGIGGGCVKPRVLSGGSVELLGSYHVVYQLSGVQRCFGDTPFDLDSLLGIAAYGDLSFGLKRIRCARLIIRLRCHIPGLHSCPRLFLRFFGLVRSRPPLCHLRRLSPGIIGISCGMP